MSERIRWIHRSLRLAVFFQAAVLCAQTCVISTAGLNLWRRVMGPVNEECIGFPHSAPFGNWGATSNFGPKVDGAQFEGWYYSGGKYQWNSCTSSYTGCSYMNWNNCTEQVTRLYGSSVMPVNVLGTVGYNLWADCPRDTDSDGVCDTGGCLYAGGWTTTNNYMTLYELDWPDADDLVQSLYFPNTSVSVSCTVAGCSPNESAYVGVSFYQTPSYPQKVDAQFKLRVNFAQYYDGSYCEYLRTYDYTYNCVY